jgi:hypothetical protein
MQRLPDGSLKPNPRVVVHQPPDRKFLRGGWRDSLLVSDLKSEGRQNQDPSLKGDDVMKLFLFAVTALLTLANGSTAARAFSSNSVVMATVPFNFSVGHEQLPSGTYTLSQDQWGLVTLKSLDRRVNVIITTTNEPCSMSGDKLVFRRYGGHYFLGKVSTSVLSAHFPVSKSEETIRYQLMDEGQTPVAARSRP